MNHSQISLPFPAVKGKEVVARFDGGDVTSDAGLLLLSEADQHLGITQALIASIEDCRQQGKVQHSLVELVRTRVYGVAQGYSDCNDLDRLRHDPALKLSCGILPGEGPLASQPTLSRFENRVTARDIKRAQTALAREVLKQVPTDIPVATLEVDATDDPCHGQQQLKLFNGYYGEHCYVPLLFHLVEPGGRRHLLWALLRPGNASSGKGLVGTMREVLRLVREHLGKHVPIIVRADSGFGTARFIDFLESQRVNFVLGLPSNAVVTRLAEPTHVKAAAGYWFYGNGYRVFGDFEYAARTWQRQYRVVVKVEITQGEFNPRYVVTNLSEGEPEEIYLFYCERGEQENRIKEFKLDMDSGRTSCSRFRANQFRLLIHTAAYALMNGVRGLLQGTHWQRAQLGTLRLRLLKVGARIVESTRKVWVHLPTSYPNHREWEHVASRLCARRQNISGICSQSACSG
jgi:hypothetical protein